MLTQVDICGLNLIKLIVNQQFPRRKKFNTLSCNSFSNCITGRYSFIIKINYLHKMGSHSAIKIILNIKKEKPKTKNKKILSWSSEIFNCEIFKAFYALTNVFVFSESFKED